MVKKYLSFLFFWPGQMTRKEYLIGVLVALCLFFMYTLLLSSTLFSDASTLQTSVVFHIALIIQEVILYWTFICLTAKRLRDCNAPVWSMLPMLIKPALLPGALFLMLYKGGKEGSGKVILGVLTIIMFVSIYLAMMNLLG